MQKIFSTVINKIMVKTKILYIEAKDVTSNVKWENVVAIEGIMQKHIILASDSGIELKEIAVSMSTNARQSDFNLHDWVLAEYEDEFYPGMIVTKIDETNYKISVMVKAGKKYWKWPEKTDKLIYPVEDIKKISPPEIVNSRGIYKFENFP